MATTHIYVKYTHCFSSTGLRASGTFSQEKFCPAFKLNVEARWYPTLSLPHVHMQIQKDLFLVDNRLDNLSVKYCTGKYPLLTKS